MSKFQFRKRMKLTSGLGLNVSKKGMGLSAGPKGLKLSASASGRITGSAGIPGTGISYRSALDGAESKRVVETEEDSALLDLIDNATYISIHGPVLLGNEMRKALLLLASSTVTVVVYVLTAFGPLGLLLNPFLYIYIGLTLGYLVESKKNKTLVKLRKIEHLRSCSHIDKN